jgi:hypothetical protein
MKKNSNAFVIIKSLSMSEKRYFKIFSERHTIGEQNKYVTLFDELDKAEQENDVELKKNLKKVGINTDFISADKNYLYQLILRSLNVFHDSKTYNLEIKQSLISIEILFHKGLYHESIKLIAKAEELAKECENFQLMIDILIWKKKCCGYSLGLKKAAEVNSEIDKYILLLNNVKRITDLYYESNLIQATNEKQSQKEVLKKLNSILSQPELKSEKHALSFSAKIFYYLIYSNYYYSLDNKQKEYDHLQKLVDILNQSKTYAVENPLDYVSIYNRLLSIKKFFPKSTFFEDIKVLNDFPKKINIRKEVVAERVFIHTNTHELEYYLINNNFQEALNKIKEIEKEISKLNVDIEPYHIIYFYYLHAITLIYVGQFHKALKFINKTLNEFGFGERPQVYLRIEVLNVITHYELKNYALVSSLLKQILKKNTSKNILTPFEEHILNALYKITNAKHLTQKEETSIFQALVNALNKNKPTSLLSSNLLNENYEKWLTAKLKRKLVYELYK